MWSTINVQRTQKGSLATKTMTIAGDVTLKCGVYKCMQIIDLIGGNEKGLVIHYEWTFPEWFSDQSH